MANKTYLLCLKVEAPQSPAVWSANSGKTGGMWESFKHLASGAKTLSENSPAITVSLLKCEEVK